MILVKRSVTSAIFFFLFSEHALQIPEFLETVSWIFHLRWYVKLQVFEDLLSTSSQTREAFR